LVYGKILEVETNQPLEYATIILKNTKTKKKLQEASLINQGISTSKLQKEFMT